MIGQSTPAPASEAPEAPLAGTQADGSPQAPARPAEIGGRGGPEPTRYGDWEKNGRCIDF